ncbi:uncharacterized protein FN964_004311 [Alca torda]
MPNPTGLHLGGKRRALPWLAPRSCVGAHAQQLIILFIIVAPRFAVLFESIVGMTRESYVWVGREASGEMISPLQRELRRRHKKSSWIRAAHGSQQEQRMNRRKELLWMEGGGMFPQAEADCTCRSGL